MLTSNTGPRVGRICSRRGGPDREGSKHKQYSANHTGGPRRGPGAGPSYDSLLGATQRPFSGGDLDLTPRRGRGAVFSGRGTGPLASLMPRPLPWIKYWLDSLHNPKLIRLSLAERGAWWGLLGLAGELGGYDSDGALVAGGQPLTLDEIAESLHIKQADRPHLDSMVEKMVCGGSLAWNGNTLYVVNWDERQHIPTSDRPEAVKERVRLHRERQKQKPLNNPPHPKKEKEKEKKRVTRYTPLQNTKGPPRPGNCGKRSCPACGAR